MLNIYEEGLASPFAENVLRKMDKDGYAGLRDASVELLARIREATLGYPRALEAFYGEAIATFRAARRIAAHAGVVKRVLRLFDELAKCGPAGALAEVRKAAEGRE